MSQTPLDLRTPIPALERYLTILKATLTALDDSLGLELRSDETTDHFGHGPCTLTRAIIGWRPLESKLERSELHTAAHLLALALDCPLLVVALVPLGLERLPFGQVEAALGVRPAYGLIDLALERLKTRQSAQLAAERRG